MLILITSLLLTWLAKKKFYGKINAIILVMGIIYLNSTQFLGVELVEKQFLYLIMLLSSTFLLISAGRLIGDREFRNIMIGITIGIAMYFAFAENAFLVESSVTETISLNFWEIVRKVVFSIKIENYLNVMIYSGLYSLLIGRIFKKVESNESKTSEIDS